VEEQIFWFGFQPDKTTQAAGAGVQPAQEDCGGTNASDPILTANKNN